MPDELITAIDEEYSTEENYHSTDSADGREKYADTGISAVRYDDVDPNGNEHLTYRLVVDLDLAIEEIVVDEDGCEVAK